jgi:hypothetical protein
MDFELDAGIAVLERTPATLAQLLDGLPDAWIGSGDPASWAPFDIVGHLIHGERTDWLPRAEIILAEGAARPFEPFDRQAQFRDSEGRSMAELLATFSDLRRSNLARLRALAPSEADLDKTGLHPELGAVTLRELLATWVVHDLSHLAQIAEHMARRYQDAAGPWWVYLPVLGGED